MCVYIYHLRQGQEHVSPLAIFALLKVDRLDYGVVDRSSIKLIEPTEVWRSWSFSEHLCRNIHSCENSALPPVPP